MIVAVILRTRLIRVAAALALACAAAGVGAQSTLDDPASKLATVLADLAHGVPQERGRFVAARSAIDGLPKSVQDAIAGRTLRLDAAGRAQVYILLAAATDDTISQLVANGVTIEVTDAAHRRVQARVPASRLMAVAQLPFVDEIRLPSYARRRIGAATSEGDAILHADAVRGLSLDGTGVRVGVISDGIKGVFATGCTNCGGVDGGPIGSSDLPAAAGVRNASGVLTSVTAGIVARSFASNSDLEGTPPASCAFQGAGAEGTALLEIVHDLAPGAKLSFANGDTDLEFNQAVNFLAASNDVVLDDIGFFGLPYDGTSGVSANTAAALNNASFPIRAYFTSVGNDADEHYLGTYTDSGVDGTTISGIATSGRLHLFQRTADTTDVLGLGAQPYNVIRLPQNGEVAIFLTWNDAFGASSNNYDLYLVRQSTGAVVASSRSPQNGRQDPVEIIDYVNNTGAADTFRIVVQNVNNAAQAKQLNLFSFQPECAVAGPSLLAPPRHERHNYNTASRSVSAQGDAGGSPVSVISVGAICSASASAAGQFSSSAPDESCNDTSNSTIEFFSSQGPTIDGRTKPDISAIDGVSITGAGSFPSPFFGTSAASPHMGGIAALVLQSAPCLLNRSASTIAASAARQTLRNLLLNNAAPLGGSTSNNVFGAGRADAIASMQKTVPLRTGATTLTFDGNTPLGASLTPAQLGFSDPVGCALTTLNWSGGCGTGPNSTMTCPFGTNAVTVSASNNGVGFSSSSDLSITVTDFSLNVSPSSATLAAGQSATFAVTVSPQNGRFSTPIALSCNGASLPPGTSCSFNPDTVTPGTSVVRSTLTVTTTQSAAAPPVQWRRWLRPPSGAARLAVQRALLLLAAMSIAAILVRGRRRATGAIAVAGVIAAAAVGVEIAAAPTAGLALFPSSVVFGSQIVSTTTPARIVSLTNVGADALSLINVAISGDFAQTNTCGTSLASGATCSVLVTFTPTATGSRTGALTLVDDAPGAPHNVSLTGTGVSAPAAGATPAGSYVVTISGTSGQLTHTAAPSLTVQ